MEVTVNVCGTREQFDELFLKADIRLLELKGNKWRLALRLPEFNDKEHPYRYYRLKTIKGLLRKLEKHGHLSEQLLVRKAII